MHISRLGLVKKPAVLSRNSVPILKPILSILAISEPASFTIPNFGPLFFEQSSVYGYIYTHITRWKFSPAKRKQLIHDFVENFPEDRICRATQ